MNASLLSANVHIHVLGSVEEVSHNGWATADEAVRLYKDPGDKPARQLAGLLAREFAKQAAEAFAGQAAQVVIS